MKLLVKILDHDPKLMEGVLQVKSIFCPYKLSALTQETSMHANKINKQTKLFFLKMVIVQLYSCSLYHSLMLSHACLMGQADCRVSLSSAGSSDIHHDGLSLGRITQRLLKHAQALSQCIRESGTHDDAKQNLVKIIIPSLRDPPVPSLQGKVLFTKSSVYTGLRTDWKGRYKQHLFVKTVKGA